MLIDGIEVFGTPDEKAMVQARDVATRAERVALMGDHHLGYIMPIGGVAAYDNKISVAGVGFDIACGNCAIKTDLLLSDISDVPAWQVSVADEIAARLSFGIGKKNSIRDLENHELFSDERWILIEEKYREELREKARAQLGTIGSGNHYIDAFVDDNDSIWVGVHFGSRGFGHTIASGFMAIARGEEWGTRGAEVEGLLDLDTLLGKSYWELMNLAGDYAYAGREWVAHYVVEEILGAAAITMVHNHHNFAWKEIHEDRELVVVRKGATPAFPNQYGFVGGSMGDDAYIIKGAATPDPDIVERQERAMYSTIHGAGRVMSRSAAKGSRQKIDKSTGKLKAQKKKGAITRQMMSEWTKKKGVVVRGGDVDESPHVYRRLNEVIEAQGLTINVVEVLKPLVVVMAGADVVDPFRD